MRVFGYGGYRLAREGKLKEKEIVGEKLEKRDGLVLGATAGSGGSGLESTMVDDLWVWERGWSMGLEREVA